MEYQHEPAMIKEVLNFLNPQPGQNYIDCTLGGGGHSLAIVDRIGEDGKIISIDCDLSAIDNIKNLINKNKNQNIIFVHDNYRNLHKIVKTHWSNIQNTKFSGIIFDLGLSSAQLADRYRGFSFQSDVPLDMSFGQIMDENRQKTKNILNKWSEKNIEKIIRKYGEEKYAKRIAQAIAIARKEKPIARTGQLVEIIKNAVPDYYKRGIKIHFATKTFQALRIAVNNELDNLEQALPQAIDLLASGGKILVISYHSLEDRIIKNFFKQESRDCLCPPSFPTCRCQHQAKLKILTKKVIRPTGEEIKNNPRARSAKMRIAEKI